MTHAARNFITCTLLRFIGWFGRLLWFSLPMLFFVPVLVSVTAFTSSVFSDDFDITSAFLKFGIETPLCSFLFLIFVLGVRAPGSRGFSIFFYQIIYPFDHFGHGLEIYILHSCFSFANASTEVLLFISSSKNSFSRDRQFASLVKISI